MSLVGHEIRLLDKDKATVGVLWNAHNPFNILDASVNEIVEGEDVVRVVTADFTYETQLTSDNLTRYIRLINLRDTTKIRTYHVKQHQIVREMSRKAIEVVGERIWIHLQDRYRYTQKRDFSNIQIGDLFTEILAGSFTGATAAASEFQIGTVATDTEVVDFFPVKWDTPLGMIRRLCKKMGREMAIDESTSPITLDFPAAIGDASSKARLYYVEGSGVNLKGVLRKQDYAQRVTRMYAIGGGDPPVTIAASSLSGGNDYVDSANFDADDNHWVGKYENAEIEDITNRIADASNPDLSGTYTAGLCAGWSKIGTPTVTENTDKTYWKYGSKSQKVVAADGEGVSVPFTASTDQRMTGWVNIYSESIGAAGVIRVEFTDADGKRYLNGEDGVTATGQFVTVERAGLEHTNATGTLKIYAEGDAATFYVDAAFVDNGDQFRKFAVGDMVDVLYNEANDELAKVDDDTAFVTYEVDAIDVFEVDPDRYPDYEIELGDTITVEDSELPNITASLRVKEKAWNPVFPEQARFQVGAVIKANADIIAEQAARAQTAEAVANRSQEAEKRAAATPALTRPVSAQTARFDGQFTSTSHNSFSWGAGTIHIGSDIKFSVGAGSITGLTASSNYWIYFDMADPTSEFQATTTYADTVGTQKLQVAFVVTHAAAEAGLSISPSDGSRPQLSGDDVITGIVDASLVTVRAPGSGSAKVDIDSVGIRAYNSSGTQTVEVNVDGSGRLGDSGGNPITWTTAGVLSVPGGIVATGIDADNITTGKISVGGAASNDRIDIDWATEDIVLYRGGTAILDLGNISDTALFATYGGAIDHPEGAWFVRRDGDVGTVGGLIPTAIGAVVNRDVDEGNASPGLDIGFYSSVDIATKTSGAFGPGVGYYAVVDNDDGEGWGYVVNKAEGTTEAVGFLGIKVTATEASSDAFGVKLEDVEAGGTSGDAYGFKVDGGALSGGGDHWGVYSDDGNNWMNGYLRIGNIGAFGSPTNAIEIGSVDLSAGHTMLAIQTEGSNVVGTGTPTQDRTVAMEVNGTTFYLLASTSAS